MEKPLRILRHDAWATSDGVVDPGPFLLRFRVPVLERGQGGAYTRNLVVCWPYADDGTGALPNDAELEAMAVFENRLCAAWESDGVAVLTAVLTFDGARQWVFYTRDVAECGRRIEAMPQEPDPYPIELTTTEDPEWNYLRDRILWSINWQASQPEWEQALATDSAATPHGMPEENGA
jgi:hypothetical protein